MGQKHRLVKVRADFEQTIVNKAIDQWSSKLLLKAKGQHYEHSLFVIDCIVSADESSFDYQRRPQEN